MRHSNKFARTLLAGVLAGSVALVGCGNATNNGTQADAAAQQEAATTEAASSAKGTIDYLVLVNKTHKLPDDWEETVDIVEAPNPMGEGHDPIPVERKAYDAFLALQEDLKKEGVDIELDSCYRKVAKQQEIWDEFTERYGADYVKSHVAVPGYSEHHTGLALDLYLVVDGKDVYENEDMMKQQDVWDKVHAKLADYGFILHYAPDKVDITGYDYEPWHIRYVGVEPAKEMQAAGQTLEEYLGEVDAPAAASDKSSNAEASLDGVEVDYGTSSLYTKDDIDAAIKVVVAELGTWKGCTLKSISYTDDKTCADELNYVNELRESRDDGMEMFDEAIVLKTNFHSPSAEDAKGTAWEPDTDYNDYGWSLGRSKGGEWRLMTWGYA